MTYSGWLKTNTGLPQGSVLDQLVFNIFINEFIYIIEHSEVCNFCRIQYYFSCNNSFEVVASSLEEDMSKSMSWFKNKSNDFECIKISGYIFGLNSNTNMVLEVGGCSIDVTNRITLLGVAIDFKLNFN